MADVFGLADKDNDKTLYQVVKELDEFWDIIEQEISCTDENLREEATQWYEE